MVATKWTLQACIDSALPYNTPTEWRDGDRNAYQAACRKKWVKQCCKHMSDSKWTLKKCIESTKECQSPSEWRKKNTSAYQAALRNQRNKWLEQCYQAIKKQSTKTTKQKPHSTSQSKSQSPEWSAELCIQSALKFDNRADWRKGDAAAYFAAHQNGWLRLCYEHMEGQSYISEPTLEDRIEQASGHDAYSSHLDTLDTAQWTLHMCLESALPFDSREEWQEEAVEAYKIAHSMGWVSQCCKHMGG